MLIRVLDLVNGTYACENDKILNDVLKREFGFQGCEFSPLLLHFKAFDVF